MLTRVRAEWFPTVQRLAQMGKLPAEWKTKCPFCKRDTPETVTHMLLGCTRWKRDRARTKLTNAKQAAEDCLRRQSQQPSDFDDNQQDMDNALRHDDNHDHNHNDDGDDDDEHRVQRQQQQQQTPDFDEHHEEFLAVLLAGGAGPNGERLEGWCPVAVDDGSRVSGRIRGCKLPCYAVVASFLMRICLARNRWIYACRATMSQSP